MSEINDFLNSLPTGGLPTAKEMKLALKAEFEQFAASPEADLPEWLSQKRREWALAIGACNSGLNVRYEK